MKIAKDEHPLEVMLQKIEGILAENEAELFYQNNQMLISDQNGKEWVVGDLSGTPSTLPRLTDEERIYYND